MSASADALAAAAQALVGCPFRLHGRDPATGLDCVGLIAAALAAVGVQPAAPEGYALRHLDIARWLPMAARSGLTPAGGPVRRGDVMLIALPTCQHHLVIAVSEARVVHAHAGLRRVVCQPFDPAWRIAARWHVSPHLEG